MGGPKSFSRTDLNESKLDIGGSLIGGDHDYAHESRFDIEMDTDGFMETIVDGFQKYWGHNPLPAELMEAWLSKITHLVQDNCTVYIYNIASAMSVKINYDDINRKIFNVMPLNIANLSFLSVFQCLLTKIKNDDSS